MARPLLEKKKRRRRKTSDCGNIKTGHVSWLKCLVEVYVREDLVTLTLTQLHIHRGDKRQQKHNDGSDLKKEVCNYNINLSCFVGVKVLLTGIAEIGFELYRRFSHVA